MSSLVSDRLNELYKKYFQETDYKLGQSFDTVRGNMSDEDYDLSQKLLNYYGQQNTLTNNYNHSSEVIEQERKKDLQQNSIAREKTMKYLPEYLNSIGLGGLGVSQSAVIKAQNNFNNNRNSINTTANSRLAELLNNYQTNMGNIDQNYITEEDNIRSKYQAIEDEKLTNQYNSYLGMLDNGEFSNASEVDAWYNNIKGTFDKDRESVLNERVTNYKNKLYNQETQDIYNELTRKIQEGEFNTTAELENYYNSVKDRFSESQNSIIGSQIDFFKKNLAQQQADAEYEKQTELDNKILSGKEYVKYNGIDYQIQPNVSLNQDWMKLLYINPQALLGTNNPYGSEIKNGTTVSEEEVYLSALGQEYYDLFNKKSRERYKNQYLTYYNGEWYSSVRR